jgi:hypothetical protein
MRIYSLLLALLTLCAPKAVFALKTTGDCAGIGSPPEGDFACTGDVTVSSEWLNLGNRAYTIRGNLTLEGGYLLLTSDLTVLGNLSASKSAQIKIAGKVSLVVQATGNADGRLDLTSGSSFQIAGLSVVTVRAQSMNMDKGTASYTYTDNILRGKSGCGPGEGGNGYYGGGGAAHGGAGSASPDGVGGSKLYGSMESPVDTGSCGGTSSSGSGGRDLNSGGIGGPAIRLQVLDELKVNGSLGADGTPGSCTSVCSPCPCDFFGGAGSGGSLWIEAKTLVGNGSIHATGGKGGYSAFTKYAGSGGGGRVAIYAPPGFAGTITALGGADNGSGRVGGEGTVFFSPPWSSGIDGGIDGGRDWGADGSTSIGNDGGADRPTESDARDAPAEMDVPTGVDALDLPQRPEVAVSVADASLTETALGQGLDAATIVAVSDARSQDVALPGGDARGSVDLSTADAGIQGMRDAGTGAPASAKSSGCGCALAGRNNRSSSLWFLAAVLLVLVSKRGARRWSRRTDPRSPQASSQVAS